MSEQRIELSQSDAGTWSSNPVTDGPLRVCLIRLGGEFFAIPLSNVREVFKLESITCVPGMPAALVGVANLRGTIVPIADLRPSLGLSHAAQPQFVVVVRQGEGEIGLLIDEVPEIRTVTADELVADTATETMRRPFLSGRLNIENRLRVILDVEGILASMEKSTLQIVGASQG